MGSIALKLKKQKRIAPASLYYAGLNWKWVCVLYLGFITSLLAHDAFAKELVSPFSDNLNKSSKLSVKPINADGRCVVFTSGSDVYVRDYHTNVVKLVSISTTGEQANDESFSATISGDGRFIVFLSKASNLVDNDTNNFIDVFLHDRLAATTIRINVNDFGGQANAQTAVSSFHHEKSQPIISKNGRYVIYSSDASNLVENDTNNFTDVFIYDRIKATTKRVSLATDGSQANSISYFPDISGDGRYVTFYSYARNLLADNSTIMRNDLFIISVYVRDLLTGTTELVSMNSSGDAIAANFGAASISSDGRFIAFKVDTINWRALEPVVPDQIPSGIYIRDLHLKTTELVSMSSSGEAGNSISRNPRVSDDGNFIVFHSDSYNLVNLPVTSRTHTVGGIYVHNRLTGTTEIVSSASATELENGISNTPSISADGSYILFNSSSTNLVEGNLSNKHTRGYIVNNSIPIEMVGEPNIDLMSEAGIYVWRDSMGKTYIQTVAGGLPETGKTAVFSGLLDSSAAITNLMPISLETTGTTVDSLIMDSPNIVKFNLYQTTPNSDRFSFDTDYEQSLCLILNKYQGGLFLGPKKHEVLPHFDINRLTSCKRDVLELDGAPNIDKNRHHGWFIWRENCTWHSRFLAGESNSGFSNSFRGRIKSTQGMYDLLPFSIEGPYTDKLNHNPDNDLSFSLTVKSGYQDGFAINIFEHASTNITGSSIFIGPDRIPMQSGFDLKTLTDNDLGLSCDVDVDNDGIPNLDDAFPLDPKETVDTDGDGIGDNADKDDDNDWVLDEFDAFPLDRRESVDSDYDGIGNNADQDDDNDGVSDKLDDFPLDPEETVDTDHDGIGNNADRDDDNDGVPDFSDVFPLDPQENIDSDGDGTGNNSDMDDDNDSINDSLDNCRLTHNPDQSDNDKDGIGDACDFISISPVLDYLLLDEK